MYESVKMVIGSEEKSLPNQKACKKQKSLRTCEGFFIALFRYLSSKIVPARH